MTVKSKIFSFYKDLISHAVSCLILIAISGVVDVEVSLHHPLGGFLSRLVQNPDTQLMIKRITWSCLQIIPAFIFGIISDHHLRKKVLIYTQIFGVLGSFLLLFFQFEFWVFLFIGLTCNPLSVARAAMLDNYPKLSALKIIAVTFMVKNAAWMFIDFFEAIPLLSVIMWILPIQAVNVFLTKWFFQDKFEDKVKMREYQDMEKHHKTNRFAILLTVLAVSLSETTFYLLWTFLETSQYLEKWLFVTTLGTYLGTTFTLMYRRIPHPSLIAILYSSGAGIMLVTLLYIKYFGLSYTENLIAALSHYCIIGGIYLPFVADAIIELSGSIRKATGSAIFEIGDMIALFLASVASIFFIKSPHSILVVNAILYTIATIIQKMSEKHYLVTPSPNIDS